MPVIFDIETNGLLDTLDTIHCISLQWVHEDGTPKGDIFSCNNAGGSDYSIQDALAELTRADVVVGHNIAAFDIPALTRVYPGFKVKGFRDTLLMSTLAYPDTSGIDFALRKGKGRIPLLPGRLMGRHTLEAWGHRLGCWKGDYVAQCKAGGIDPWAAWNQDMEAYCKRDVQVTQRLYQRLLGQPLSAESITLEHAVAPILARQHRQGFLFDLDKALELERRLIRRRSELQGALEAAIEPWQEVKRTFTPKRDDKRRGYQKGVEVTTYREVTFNPASRDHIANRLNVLYGWQPQELTDKGKPKVDEEVLSGLDYPLIPPLLEYITVNKRLGQLSEGREAWLNAIAGDGRIHGHVHQNATVTGRMSHSKPNLAQVPRVGNPYGAECRELFCVPQGRALVGVDASGLELRCLAHYTARYDGGAYAGVILEGDIHSLTRQAAGLPTRDVAKTFIYAFLYGAGNARLGAIVGKGPHVGGKLRKQFLAELPALDKLIKDVQAAAQKRGWLRGLDGRRLHIRSQHAALNTLLQSAGALVMKQALVIADQRLQAEFGTPGVDYEFVANIHDEFQIEVSAANAAFVGEICTQAIRQAGAHFKFRCPLDGAFKVGTTWADTH